MLLTGAFARSIDEKQRIAIPKRFREALGCLEGGVLYVTPGTDGSLALYSEEALARLSDRLEQGSPNQQHIRAYTRLFYAQTQAVEFDRQGRIRVPAELASLAGLDKEAMLLGVQDHLELWSAARWQEYLDEKQRHYDEIAEAAFDPRGRSESAGRSDTLVRHSSATVAVGEETPQRIPAATAPNHPR